VSFPRGAAGGRLELTRLAPSGRSLLTGILILLIAVGAYAAARETSAFAVRQVSVAGAGPEVAAEVREALAPALGESLLELDLDRLARSAEGVPMVAAVSFDRAFPNTLGVVVREEVPVAVLRQGSASWLAAASGRVVAELERGARPVLPRIWLGRDVDVRTGEQLRGVQRRAVAAVAPLVSAPLPVRVASVVASRGELTLVLRTKLELRLGDASELALKLEVARRVVPQLGATDTYLDVSVPERPVAGGTLNSQVEVETLPSTFP
jgi:cell division protein FtsQ